MYARTRGEIRFNKTNLTSQLFFNEVPINKPDEGRHVL